MSERIGVEVVTPGRTWKCRLLRHGSCSIARHAPAAVAYPNAYDRIEATGWLRCPCRCHGVLPTSTNHYEPAGEKS